MFEKIITFILNYIVAPILAVLLFIWKFIQKLLSDVAKHAYGKILVPLLAILIITYIYNIFFK